MDRRTGAQLRAAREQRGASVDEVAAAVGVPAEGVAALEEGSAAEQAGYGLAAAWTWAVGRHLGVDVESVLARAATPGGPPPAAEGAATPADVDSRLDQATDDRWADDAPWPGDDDRWPGDDGAWSDEDAGAGSALDDPATQAAPYEPPPPPAAMPSSALGGVLDEDAEASAVEPSPGPREDDPSQGRADAEPAEDRPDERLDAPVGEEPGPPSPDERLDAPAGEEPGPPSPDERLDAPAGEEPGAPSAEERTDLQRADAADPQPPQPTTPVAPGWLADLEAEADRDDLDAWRPPADRADAPPPLAPTPSEPTVDAGLPTDDGWGEDGWSDAPWAQSESGWRPAGEAWEPDDDAWAREADLEEDPAGAEPGPAEPGPAEPARSAPAAGWGEDTVAWWEADAATAPPGGAGEPTQHVQHSDAWPAEPGVVGDTGEIPAAEEDTRVIAYTEGEDAPRLEPPSRLRVVGTVLLALVLLVAAGVGVGLLASQLFDAPPVQLADDDEALVDDFADDEGAEEAEDPDPDEGVDEAEAEEPEAEEEPDDGEADDAAPADAPEPGDTTVQVLNGSGDADRYADAIGVLGELGYQTIESGSAASSYEQTTVFVTEGHEDAGAALAERDERFEHREPNDVGLSEDVELHVIVGEDW